jgi:hypothetical protein
MALFDNLLGAEEDQLSKAAPGEADNLQLHVEMCARRYKTLADRLRNQNRLLWVLVALLLANKVIDLSQFGIIKLF